MDKISVGEAAQGASVRQPNSAPVEQRGRAPRPVPNESQLQGSVPKTSVTSAFNTTINISFSEKYLKTL